MQQFREVSRTRTIYSTETQATLYLIRTEMGSQSSFSRRGVEWWWRGAKRTSLAAKFFNFLERLDDRIRCTHEETVALVEPWDDIGSNKSLGCVFGEKPAD